MTRASGNGCKRSQFIRKTYIMGANRVHLNGLYLLFNLGSRFSRKMELLCIVIALKFWSDQHISVCYCCGSTFLFRCTFINIRFLWNMAGLSFYVSDNKENILFTKKMTLGGYWLKDGTFFYFSISISIFFVFPMSTNIIGVSL